MTLKSSLRLTPTAQLSLAAAFSALVYLVVLLWPYPLWSLYLGPQLDLGQLARHDGLAALVLAGGYALIFWLYLAGYRAARRIGSARGVWWVILPALSFAAILLWVYPVGATDVYDYVFRGRLWGLYDYNPLTVAPMQVSGDPWYPYVTWVWSGSPYGPLWADLSVTLYRLAGDDWLRNLLAFKLLAAVCIPLCALLIHDMLQEGEREQALGGVLLFAWNPLLLFEGVVNGHNDLVMTMLIVLALWLYARQHARAALAACTLAALVKVTALIALPVIGLAGLRRLPAGRARRQYLMTGAALCVLIAAALYAPLWAGPATFDALAIQDNRFTASLAAVTKLGLEAVWGTEAAEAWARASFSVLFVVIALYRLRAAARTGVPAAEARLGQQLFDLFTLLLLTATLWFQPWYVIWVVALMPLAGPARARWAIIWSASALSLYLLFDFVWFWYPEFLNTANVLVLNGVAVLMWLAPLAGYGALERRRARAR